MALQTFHPTPPPRPARLTNLRPCRCAFCARPISAGRGVPHADRYLCPDCVELQDRRRTAARYQANVLTMVPNLGDWWLVNSMLSKVILRSGLSAPLILQAIEDRAAWLEPATYVGVCEIALQETRALGFDFQVW